MGSTDDAIDITPGDSVTPIYLVGISADEAALNAASVANLAANAVAAADVRASAMAKLAALGLTEEEARAIAGG